MPSLPLHLIAQGISRTSLADRCKLGQTIRTSIRVQVEWVVNKYSPVFWVFVAATLVWIGFVWLIAPPWSAFLKLEPNQKGDFLAGVAGPLAILWLIASYLLQAKELKASIAEQKLLVTAAREQSEATRMAVEQASEQRAQELRPIFIVNPKTLRFIDDHLTPGNLRQEYSVENVGSTAFEPNIYMGPGPIQVTEVSHTPPITHGSKVTFATTMPRDASYGDYRCFVSARDLTGRLWTDEFVGVYNDNYPCVVFNKIHPDLASPHAAQP